MAKNVEHILHKRNSGNTAPSTDSIEYGEIAINYKAGSEKIYIKNSDGTIVPFSPNGGGPAPEISISGGTSGVSATASGMALGIVTNGDIVKLDNFQHDPRNAESGYTNEGNVTASTEYDSIVSGGTGQTVNSAISKLENEIISLWKMLGKNDFDKTHYGTTVHNLVSLDNFQHDPHNAESGYTNESHVTASTEYDSIISDNVTARTVSSSISKLENEIVNLWKMLGKKDFDKTHYGTTVHNLVSLDNFEHDPRNAESGYTNEGHVTASTEYDSIISDSITARTVSSSISKLENEIINLWKMLGKKDFDKNYYGVKTVYDLISATPVAPAISISGGTSGVSATSSGMTLGIVTNGDIVKLDNYTPQAQTADSGYTNESAVTSSSRYDLIVSGGTGQTVNSAISKLENEIINIWKMLGKKDFDKEHYGTSIYDLLSDSEYTTSTALRDLNDRVIALETKVANLETTVNNNRIIIDYLISKGL